MTDSTSRESDKFMLRLPDGMRERIKAVADANKRSMNAEIVATLADKYPHTVAEVSLAQVAEWIRHIENASTTDEVLERLDEANTFLRHMDAALQLTTLLDGTSEISLNLGARYQGHSLVIPENYIDADSAHEAIQKIMARKA